MTDMPVRYAARRQRVHPIRTSIKIEYAHRFTPSEHAIVQSQCQVCWGWVDDYRHWTR